MTSLNDSRWTLVFLAWLTATLATLGALFMSEIMALTPCVLCWYQRIFMFPLVVILALGLFPFDPKVVRYALPLGVIGLAVAAFHLLLVVGYIPETLTPCRQGVPCSTVQIEWFGFLTIPLLSFLAFLTVNALLLASFMRSPK